MRTLIVFLAGALTAICGAAVWVRSGCDVPLSSPRVSVQVATQVVAPDPGVLVPGYVAESLQSTGDHWQDHWNKLAIEKIEGLSFALEFATPKVRRHLLDRENARICLKCGELSPQADHVCRDPIEPAPRTAESTGYDYLPEGHPITSAGR